ncbi:MAG: hypothetical protein ACKOVB_10570 [Terrabacter sp.]
MTRPPERVRDCAARLDHPVDLEQVAVLSTEQVLARIDQVRTFLSERLRLDARPEPDRVVA